MCIQIFWPETIKIPVYICKPCELCGGSGRVSAYHDGHCGYTDATQDCWACDATGYILDPRTR